MLVVLLLINAQLAIGTQVTRCHINNSCPQNIDRRLAHTLFIGGHVRVNYSISIRRLLGCVWQVILLLL